MYISRVIVIAAIALTQLLVLAGPIAKSPAKQTNGNTKTETGTVTAASLACPEPEHTKRWLLETPLTQFERRNSGQSKPSNHSALTTQLLVGISFTFMPGGQHVTLSLGEVLSSHGTTEIWSVGGSSPLSSCLYIMKTPASRAANYIRTFGQSRTYVSHAIDSTSGMYYILHHKKAEIRG